MIGRTLGHFEILEKLGEGGMGAVYKAHDTHLDRFVAIKVLSGDRAADLDRLRLVREAKTASSLKHPGIVTIHDITRHEDIDFIAMELVPGRTLDRVIPRHGLALPEVLEYGIQIADALAAAHSAGVVHRDLKPANVIVSDHGRIKVLDFGLAKLVGPVGLGERGQCTDCDAVATSHRAGRHRGYCRVHVAGAGGEQARRHAHRRLQLRLRALRDGDRAACLPARLDDWNTVGDPAGGAEACEPAASSTSRTRSSA